jgi:hypothetical protein
MTEAQSDRRGDIVLMRAWAENLRAKARAIRAGVSRMDESCEELADIIERYVKARAG